MSHHRRTWNINGESKFSTLETITDYGLVSLLNRYAKTGDVIVYDHDTKCQARLGKVWDLIHFWMKEGGPLTVEDIPTTKEVRNV